MNRERRSWLISFFRQPFNTLSSGARLAGPALPANHQEARMGKLMRVVILSALFIGTLLMIIIANGGGPQMLALARSALDTVLQLLKIPAPG
jgi:hypothetical protein